MTCIITFSVHILSPSETGRDDWASLVGQMLKNLPEMQEIQVQSLHQEGPLENGMATHSSIFAWRIPQRSLASYRSWGHKESDTNEQLTLSFYFQETEKNDL